MNKKNLILILVIIIIIIILLLVGVTVFNGPDDDNLANGGNDEQKIEQGNNGGSTVNIYDNNGKDEQYDGLKDLKNDDESKDEKDILNTASSTNNAASASRPEIYNPEVVVKQPQVSFSSNGSNSLTPKFETRLVIRNTQSVSSVYWTVASTNRVNVDSKLHIWKKCSYDEKFTLEDMQGTKYIWVKVTLNNGVVLGYSTGAINMRKYYDLTPTFNPNTVSGVSSVSISVSFAHREDISSVYYSVQNSANVTTNANWTAMPGDNKVNISSNTTETKYVWIKVVRVDGKVFYYSSKAYNLKNYGVPSVVFNSPSGVLSNRNIEINVSNTADTKKLEYAVVNSNVTSSQYASVSNWKTISGNKVVENVANRDGSVKVLVRYTLSNGKVDYIVSDSYSMRKYNIEVGLVNAVPSGAVNSYTVDVKALSSENDIENLEYYISTDKYTNQDVSSVTFTKAGVPTLVTNENKTFYVWIKVTGKYNIGTKTVCVGPITVRAYVKPTITLDSSKSTVGSSTSRVISSSMTFNVSGIDDIIKAEYAIVDFSIESVDSIASWNDVTEKAKKGVIDGINYSPNMLTEKKVFVKITYGSEDNYISISQVSYYKTAVGIDCPSTQARAEGEVEYDRDGDVIGDTRHYRLSITISLDSSLNKSDYEFLIINKANGSIMDRKGLASSTLAEIDYSPEIEGRSIDCRIEVRKKSTGDVIGSKDVTILFPTHPAGTNS